MLQTHLFVKLCKNMRGCSLAACLCRCNLFTARKMIALWSSTKLPCCMQKHEGLKRVFLCFKASGRSTKDCFSAVHRQQQEGLLFFCPMVLQYIVQPKALFSFCATVLSTLAAADSMVPFLCHCAQCAVSTANNNLPSVLMCSLHEQVLTVVTAATCKLDCYCCTLQSPSSPPYKSKSLFQQKIWHHL